MKLSHKISIMMPPSKVWADETVAQNKYYDATFTGVGR